MTEDNLATREEGRRLHNFVVRSQHQFPIDMLRLTQCWPATSLDSDRIYNSHHELRPGETLRNIRLQSWLTPSELLWQRMGWSIILR